MPLHILSELQSREAQSVPFFAALPVLHGSGMTMLIVLFSIQSRKPAEYIKSDQMRRGRTSKEHFSTSEDAEREQLLSNASLRSGTIQHPPPVEEKQNRKKNRRKTLAAAAAEGRAAILNQVFNSSARLSAA